MAVNRAQDLAVARDLLLGAERHTDVVQAGQQPAADLMVDLERHLTAVEANLLGLEVDLPMPPRPSSRTTR